MDLYSAAAQREGVGLVRVRGAALMVFERLESVMDEFEEVVEDTCDLAALAASVRGDFTAVRVALTVKDPANRVSVERLSLAVLRATGVDRA